MERQENEIKQNRLELLEKENKMQLLIAGFICIFIAASLLYYLYYRKNKLYLTIVKQNQDAIRREQQLQNKIDRPQVRSFTRISYGFDENFFAAT